NTGASPAAPFLQTYRLLDSPRILTRQSAGLKADWRIRTHSVLTAGVQLGHFESKRIATEFTVNTGTNPVPTPASGTPFSFGDDYTIGATGRGAASMGGAASVHTVKASNAANLPYRYNDGTWRIHLGVDPAEDKGGYRDTAEGHFRQMSSNTRFPVRVTLADIDRVRPGTIQIFDNAD